MSREDILKYTSSVNDAALDGMTKTYRLVMSKSDTRLVACGDPEERKRVRENFLKKKLGLKDGNDALDQAIADVCQKMASTNQKSRLTFYYLLAEKYGKLGMFA